MEFQNTPDYHGYTEINLNAALIGLTTLFFFTRIYVRAFMTKTLGWDDAIAFVAWLLLVAQSSLDIHAVSVGSGAHIDLVPPALLAKFFESLIIQTLIYFWAVALVRLSILAFLPRLSQDRYLHYALYAVGFLVSVQTIVAFVYRLTECSPVSDNFKPPILPGLKCKGLEADQRMMIGHAVTGIVIDVALLFLPVYIIYTKMIWSRKTVQVMLVLSVGVFVIVTGIVRLIMIVTLNFTIDPTYKMATVGIWTDLEGHVGLWCGCFPALQPIIRIVTYKLGIRSEMLSGKGTSDKYGSRGGHGTLKPGAGGTRNGYVKNGSGVDETDSDSQRAIFVGKGGGGGGGNVELTEMLDLNAGIQKTTEVNVHSEPVDRKTGGGTNNAFAGHMQGSKSWVDMTA